MSSSIQVTGQMGQSPDGVTPADAGDRWAKVSHPACAAGSDSNYTFEIQTLPSDLSAGEGGESNNVATDDPQTVKEPITAADAPAAYAAQGPSVTLTPNLNALSPKPDVDPKGVAPATSVAGRR